MSVRSVLRDKENIWQTFSFVSFCFELAHRDVFTDSSDQDFY